MVRSPLRSYSPAPLIPSTSLSISNCSTASAKARRKSPSPAFSSKSASTNLSSVIGSSRVLQVEVLQLHLSRPGPMATSTTPQPYTAGRPENSTTSVDANSSLDLVDPAGVGGPSHQPSRATVEAIELPRGCCPRRAPNNKRSLVFVSLYQASSPSGVGLRLGALFRRASRGP